MWLFVWKADELSWFVNAKSRLVAHGFKQREGINFEDMSAPTASSFFVLVLSVIACELNLNLCNFHVDEALSKPN